MDEDRGREEGVLSHQLAEAAPGSLRNGGILCVCVCVCVCVCGVCEGRVKGAT